MAKTPVQLVYAVARNGVIGRDNTMPWRLPSDLKHFKSVTMGTPVIMGRRTFESIGRPLPGRRNIVVTRDRDFDHEGLDVRHGPIEALDLARRIENAPAISVIGGGTIYRQLMPEADRLIVTYVEAEPEGDTFMPPVDPELWTERSRTVGKAHPEDSAGVSFVAYERKQRRRPS